MDLKRIHVYPPDDYREHDTSGKPCWCKPRIEYEDEGVVVIHNSMDGREKFETGERKPS